jgi:hypothetical protein
MPDDQAPRFSFEVHPAAEAFPMLPEDELQALAADIRANGLFHPIVLNTEGTKLVDGRNRLAACAIADVEPRFDRLPEGVDPHDYIVSANISRRDLTKGQKALALALIYPEPEKTARGKRAAVTTLLETQSVSAARLSQARQIIKHPDLVEMVKLGSMKFDFALTQAKERETVQQNAEQFMATIEAEAPDLAVLVREEQLNLEEAWAAFVKRKTDEAMAERELNETYLRIFEHVCRGLTDLADEAVEAGLRERLRKPGFKRAALERQPIDIAKIESGFANLEQILREICP